MKANKNKAIQSSRGRRAHRTRARIAGTAERPRLSVYRSLRSISVQLINDETGTTVAAASDKGMTGTKTERATEVGKSIAAKAKEHGITSVVFDRGQHKYHGRVKAVAEGAREGGLEF